MEGVSWRGVQFFLRNASRLTTSAPGVLSSGASSADSSGSAFSASDLSASLLSADLPAVFLAGLDFDVDFVAFFGASGVSPALPDSAAAPDSPAAAAGSAVSGSEPAPRRLRAGAGPDAGPDAGRSVATPLSALSPASPEPDRAGGSCNSNLRPNCTEGSKKP